MSSSSSSSYSSHGGSSSSPSSRPGLMRRSSTPYPRPPSPYRSSSPSIGRPSESEEQSTGPHIVRPPSSSSRLSTPRDGPPRSARRSTRSGSEGADLEGRTSIREGGEGPEMWIEDLDHDQEGTPSRPIHAGTNSRQKRKSGRTKRWAKALARTLKSAFHVPQAEGEESPTSKGGKVPPVLMGRTAPRKSAKKLSTTSRGLIDPESTVNEGRPKPVVASVRANGILGAVGRPT